MKMKLTLTLEVDFTTSKIPDLDFGTLADIARNVGESARKILTEQAQVDLAAEALSATWKGAECVPEGHYALRDGRFFANPCVLCRGSQKLNDDTCYHCNGTGDEPPDENDDDANDALDDSGIAERVRAELKVM